MLLALPCASLLHGFRPASGAALCRPKSDPGNRAGMLERSLPLRGRSAVSINHCYIPPRPEPASGARPAAVATATAGPAPAWRDGSAAREGYVGVRQRPWGTWVAEITVGNRCR